MNFDRSFSDTRVKENQRGLVRSNEYCLILLERAQCKVNYLASFELWISTNRGNSFVEDFFFGDIRLAVVHGRPLLCATRSQF